MVFKKKPYYVDYKDKDLIAVEELTPEQRQYLNKINKKLQDIEAKLIKEGAELHKKAQARIDDPDDWVTDYEIYAEISFWLREDDPAFKEDDDNILLEVEEHVPFEGDTYYEEDMNFNEAEFAESHPLYGEYHCWLYHNLTDHSDLGWVNILRIGGIWLDIHVILQEEIKIT